MPDFIWLIVILPLISAVAYLMDNDGHGLSSRVLMRILRWDIAFVCLAVLEYRLLLS